MYTAMLTELADKLQNADFGREYTLNLKTGEIEESDDLSVDEWIYATDSGFNDWSLDYYFTPQADTTTVNDSLYSPAHFMALGTLRHHLADSEYELDNFSKLTVSLAEVDSYDCDYCRNEKDPDDSCLGEHGIGWAVISALVV